LGNKSVEAGCLESLNFKSGDEAEFSNLQIQLPRPLNPAISLSSLRVITGKHIKVFPLRWVADVSIRSPPVNKRDTRASKLLNAIMRKPQFDFTS